MWNLSDDDFTKLDRLADATNADRDGVLAGQLADFLKDHPSAVGPLMQCLAAFTCRPIEKLDEREKQLHFKAAQLMVDFWEFLPPESGHDA